MRSRNIPLFIAKHFILWYDLNIVKGSVKMNEEYKKYLPIGSVVMLKNGKKRLMITGYLQIDLEKPEQVYDYSGCFFPEGIISTKQNMLFNHDDIDKIYCIGYNDEEQRNWNTKLHELSNEENIKKMLDSVKGQK